MVRALLVAMVCGVLSGTSACVSVFKKLDADEPPAQLQTGQVVEVEEVVKGDELEVEAKGGAKARVRLLGVLAFSDEIQDPEIDPFRVAAVDYLRQQVLHKKVTLTLGATPTDSSGRYLAYVGVGDAASDVNQTMVADGYSVVYTEFGFEREAAYLAAEAAARAGKKQLWSHARPTQVTTGLRRQWAKFRAERPGKAPADPLLMQQ